ncbi:MAG: hypothetical protein ACKVQB_10220, partial [Bacteroidia bacterium]
IINQTSQNLISTFTNNELSHINKTLTNHTSINMGLTLLGGIKYNFTSKIAVGIESGINGGINLGTNENKSSQFSITDKVSTQLNTTRSNSTALYFHTNLINAIWFSYKF